MSEFFIFAKVIIPLGVIHESISRFIHPHPTFVPGFAPDFYTLLSRSHVPLEHSTTG